MNGPIIDVYGDQRWFNTGGRLHRTDGPAVIYVDGSQAWLLNGMYHRTDGPARSGSDGSQKWYINGVRKIKNKSFQRAAKLSDEDMTALILKYGNVK